MYGYQSNDQAPVHLTADAVEVDRGRSALRINHMDRITMKKKSVEFPLLRFATCTECNSVVSAYGEGSIRDREELAEVLSYELFDKPWGKYGTGWKLIDVGDGFALIADRGHKFKLECSNGHYRLLGQCSTKERVLVALPRPQTTKPEAKPEPKPSKKRVQAAAPRPQTAEPKPPAGQSPMEPATLPHSQEDPKEAVVPQTDPMTQVWSMTPYSPTASNSEALAALTNAASEIQQATEPVPEEAALPATSTPETQDDDPKPSEENTAQEETAAKGTEGGTPDTSTEGEETALDPFAEIDAEIAENFVPRSERVRPHFKGGPLKKYRLPSLECEILCSVVRRLKTQGSIKVRDMGMVEVFRRYGFRVEPDRTDKDFPDTFVRISVA